MMTNSEFRDYLKRETAISAPVRPDDVEPCSCNLKVCTGWRLTRDWLFARPSHIRMQESV